MTNETHISINDRSALIIGGPTASGKSALALHCAQALDGVIINADSQQIYQGLPLLSAQPPEEDLARAPHRLYDCLAPDDACDAFRWREMAKHELSNIYEEGKIPIFVGGTGLYINALVDGLSPVPDIPDDIRQNIAIMVDKQGTEQAFALLKEKDPEMASKIDGANTRRVARALEVLEATGVSLAQWQRAPKEGAPKNINFHMVVVMPDRDILRDRCNERFDQMMDNGALEEVKALNRRIDDGELDGFAPITKALGFKAIKAYLDGLVKWDEATEMAKAETRQYAKRQVTWFRHKTPENAKTVQHWNPADSMPVFLKTTDD